MNLSFKKVDYNEPIFKSTAENQNYVPVSIKNGVDTFENTSVPENKKERGKFNTFINKVIGYNTACSDGKDDGKLSIKDSAKSFLRGCANTLTNLVDSFIEKPLISSVAFIAPIALSAIAVAAGIVSAPMLAIAGGIIGLGFGSSLIIKGIISYRKADNDTEAKASFEKIGEGTLTSLLSAFSIKKGYSNIKEIKEISNSAKKLSSMSKKYVEETHENISNAENALSSLGKKHSIIETAQNDICDNLKDNVSLAKDPSLDIRQELDVQKSGYKIIQDSAEKSADILKRATDAFADAEKKAEGVFNTAKKIDESSALIPKSSTVKQALNRKEIIVRDLNSLKNDALQVSQQTDEVLRCSDEINDIEKLVNAELNKMSRNENSLKAKIDSYFKKLMSPEDDGIFGYDTSGVFDREDIRTNLLSRNNLCDSNFAIKALDPVDDSAQLPKDSKYYEIGVQKVNKRDNNKFYIFENLKQAPDNNGVRGKTPLSGNVKALRWKLKKAQDSGIRTVIDLRTEGECSSSAKSVLSDLGIEYVNFPVEDEKWAVTSLHKITEYFNAVNKGDFYVGCANGEARTDTAIAINFVFNPEAREIPSLYFGSDSSTRVSVKRNISMIFELLKNNQDIVKDWGWRDYSSFSSAADGRFKCLISSLKK